MRTAAEAALEHESADCAKKFLVNDCISDAKERHTAAIVKARQLEAPAREFEREARRAEVTAKEAKRAIDNAQRERDQEAQAAAYRAEQAAKTAKREKKQADRAAKNRLDSPAAPTTEMNTEH